MRDSNVKDGKSDVGAIDSIVGFHVRLAHGAVYRRFMTDHGHLELTPKQISVLWLIDDHHGISQVDLGRHLRMDRATTMGVVDRLEKRAYVRRERSGADGRRKSLSLTPEGRKALAEAKAAVAEHDAWLRGRFSEAEAGILLDLLVRIHD